ncbi:hypothetical protein [Avibacterium paragallinarum]|uniref:Uncharacterized protein n=1 Tax=Avibacterium paragallinarum TaxID=728 RepID=A0A8B3T602_AVIPA|nr:hypothetical protein [Avibacterium paragallinarum]RZN56073.1 hypothetical protein EIG79_10765 [Avibacterium paragallinarum]
MSFVLQKLCAPLRYLKITHREKTFFDYVLPAIATALFLAVNQYLLPKPLLFLGEKSIVSVVNGILQMLSGFYIASLAAVATFNRPEIDEQMLNAPTLNNIPVTRRLFLTHLFGYLAFISIMLYFIGGFAQIASSNISQLETFEYYNIICWVAQSLYIFSIFNLIFVTLLGLYFMIDRIHQN